MQDRSCTGCRLGKRTKEPQFGTTEVVHHNIGDLVVMDLIFLTSSQDQKISEAPTGLLSIDCYSLFKYMIWLENKSEKSINKAVDETINFYKYHGHRIREIKIDNERGALGLEEHLSTRNPPVAVSNCLPGAHVAPIESGIRYTKTLWRSTILGQEFGVPCPVKFYKSAYVNSLQSANNMLTSVNDYLTSSMMFFSKKTSYKMYMELKWGDTVATRSLDGKKDDDPRINYGVILGRQKSCGVSAFCVYNLESGRILLRGINDCVKLEASSKVKELLLQVDSSLLNSTPNVLENKPILLLGSNHREVTDDIDEEGQINFKEEMINSISLSEVERDENYYVDLRADSVVNNSIIVDEKDCNTCKEDWSNEEDEIETVSESAGMQDDVDREVEMITTDESPGNMVEEYENMHPSEPGSGEIPNSPASHESNRSSDIPEYPDRSHQTNEKDKLCQEEFTSNKTNKNTSKHYRSPLSYIYNVIILIIFYYRGWN